MGAAAAPSDALMGDVVLLDLDRTVCSFPATSRMYKRLFLQPPRATHLAAAVCMLTLMHAFWFVPAAVRLQRRIVMSLFARAPEDQLRAQVARVLPEIVADWRENLGKRIHTLVDNADAIYLISHCPEPLGEAVADALGMQGQWSVPVRDYLAGAPGDVYDKRAVLDQIRAERPDARLWYFADDLVDLGSMRAADVGTLVNGSWFSRVICTLFFRTIRVWR